MSNLSSLTLQNSNEDIYNEIGARSAPPLTATQLPLVQKFSITLFDEQI